MSDDELELDTLDDQKTALFLIMSDTDTTFNFVIAMLQSQLFNLLSDKADDVYGGRLPVHARHMIDECANIGQIPRLEKLVATIRSREISACLVLQAQSQLKAIYKDNADTIVGNCDSMLFLGGKERIIEFLYFGILLWYLHVQHHFLLLNAAGSHQHETRRHIDPVFGVV